MKKICFEMMQSERNGTVVIADAAPFLQTTFITRINQFILEQKRMD